GTEPSQRPGETTDGGSRDRRGDQRSRSGRHRRVGSTARSTVGTSASSGRSPPCRRSRNRRDQRVDGSAGRYGQSRHPSWSATSPNDHGGREVSIEQQLAALSMTAPDHLAEAVSLGTGLVDGYDFYPSPVGEVAVAFNPEGVSYLGLVDDGFFERFTRDTARTLVRAEAPTAWGKHIPEAIEAGRPGKVPVDLRS